MKGETMIANAIDNGQKPYRVVEQEFSCDHATTKAVRFVQRNGVSIVRLQCQRCGNQVGGNLPKANYNVEGLPAWDESLRNAYWQARSERTQEIYQQQQADERADWFRQYNAYLRSEQWGRLRKQVLGRDGYICQNCFRKVVPNLYPLPNRAEVHHLSYDGYNRTGQTFAFECVTLCHDCHRAYHGQEKGHDE